MPQFRLELPVHRPLENRVQTSLYFKKSYGPRTKVAGWEKYLEAEPLDNNPYDPVNYSLHHSHYNKLGIENNEKYISTTHEMLQDVYKRNSSLDVNPNKRLINVYTFNEEIYCDNLNLSCPKVCANEYESTMHQSYHPPYPYTIKRLSMYKTPFFIYRHFDFDPEKSPCKFYDDNFNEQTKLLQKYKSAKHVSYNPCTGRYTDGTSAAIEPRLCLN